MSTAPRFVEVEGFWEEIVGRADQFAGKRVRVTILPENEGDMAPAPAEINEHDVVRVRRDVETEGFSLRAGMIGAVVSVYGNGEACAVEFPDLDKGSAIVTLNRSQVEEVTGTG